MRRKVNEFLVLPGPTEIDESKVNHRKFSCLGSSIMIRWMFGVHCRPTHLSIPQIIKDKSFATIGQIIKQHIRRGSTIFSDSHQAYCVNGKSKLTQLGYFHFWTNHSFRMVHEKFAFNSSLNIEREWADIKRNVYQIKFTHNYDKLQEFMDTWVLKRRIIRQERLGDFCL